ncbi:MAG: hypothetical protein IJJ61_08645 [Clostridia bacterium]|nr:hypothetical protein [Clostridia bacterium]MBQ6468001.1 hypothetical protein [Clostridia bacterium]MBR5773010.1 hypothetical protein [Clostridia bacterium]MBR6334706.1 hypothetical protein [Clostridia bacterium]
MKIWCLKCGKLLAHTNYSETKYTVCPCCGEKIAYSVKNGTGYIADLSENLKLNNCIYIYADYDCCG